MSMLSLRLPESLHRMVREVAAKDSISIDQFIATAVAEKMSALLTEEYLEQRARRADPAGFDRILSGCLMYRRYQVTSANSPKHEGGLTSARSRRAKNGRAADASGR